MELEKLIDRLIRHAVKCQGGRRVLGGVGWGWVWGQRETRFSLLVKTLLRILRKRSSSQFYRIENTPTSRHTRSYNDHEIINR